MIVPDGGTVLGKAAFECKFGDNSGGSIQGRHEVDVCVISEMIHKNGGADISGKSRATKVDWDKASSGTLKLIDTNNLSSKGGCAKVTVIGGSFGSPRFAMGFAISTTWTHGGINIGEFAWDEAGTSHKLQSSKTQMAQLLMDDCEPLLFALSGSE